jgi:uncharacterized protein (DUF1697 family)
MENARVATWAAFLRAINVGGRRVTSADLCAPFTEMGFEDVQSFRASGNVVFRAGREAEAKLAARIEQGLESALGYDVAVFLRGEDEMRALAAHEPFKPSVIKASQGKLQVAFLNKLPAASVHKEVLARATPEDRLAFGVRELYWLPSGGISESELDMAGISKMIGVTTFRTQGTIEQIAAKWFTPAA